MKTIDISKQLPYSPLIPAIEAICCATTGEKLEVIMNDNDLNAFHELKEYLSTKNIGFREIYNKDRMILQFTV